MRWVQTDKIPYKDELGNITGIIGFSIDITAIKKARDRLLESEQRYKTLADTAPLCIKWFDAKGNLISINKHGREEHFLLDKKDEEIKNWNYMDCIEEKYRDLVMKNMQRAIEGEASNFDMEHVPGTSTGHWCRSSLIPAKNENREIKYILFISHDVTVEKETEGHTNKDLEELEKINKLMINRELKMMELKEEIKALKTSQPDF